MTTLPPGVTLQQIDGGANYYANNGLTYAVNAGWDNPSFFPIGPWLAPMVGQADVNRWKDLNLNTAFGLTGNSDVALLRSNRISAVLQSDELSKFGTPGSETVGLLTADEAGITDTKTVIGATSNSIQDGRFWWINNTWNFINYGDLSGIPAPQVLSMPFTTPNGTSRHIDVSSVDIYWFAGGKSSNPILQQGGLIDNLGRDMTPDQAARGSNYGDMITAERVFTGGAQPIYAYIEDGGPYGEDTSTSDYITPSELNWAVWSSLIHGARGVIYFNHTFAGPEQSQDNLAQPFYQTVQPGQTISTYNQVKATDALVEQLAPVLNSPTALGYVTVSPTPTTFNGIETIAKDYNGQFYIFADTRDSETQHNIPATFTIADLNATSVTVVNENRTIPVTNGVFTDTFANAWTVHIYQVNDGSSPPPPPPPVDTPSTVSVSDQTATDGQVLTASPAVEAGETMPLSPAPPVDTPSTVSVSDQTATDGQVLTASPAVEAGETMPLSPAPPVDTPSTVSVSDQTATDEQVLAASPAVEAGETTPLSPAPPVDTPSTASVSDQTATDGQVLAASPAVEAGETTPLSPAPPVDTPSTVSVSDQTATDGQLLAASPAVEAGETTPLSPADAGAVNFLSEDSPSRAGTVAGLHGQDAMDLADITFGANTTLGYSANCGNTGSTLTSSSLNAPSLALLGQYSASSFIMASDGNGGTLITDPAPSQQPLLTLPHP